MTITDVNERLNALFPPETAWSGDAIGLQVGRYPENAEIKSILIAYEINKDVISEAVDHRIDCICVFHPLIFSPLKSITGKDKVSSHVHDLIRLNIGLIAIHTNFDTHPSGTNVLAAKSLDIVESTIRPLVPDAHHEKHGMGIIGMLPEPMDPKTFAEKCSATFGSPIRYALGTSKDVQTIAMVCGSGSQYMQTAIEAKADCFITADVKYHQFHAAQGTIMLIDPGHAEMEQFVAEGMKHVMKSDDILKNLTIMASSIKTSPILYA